MAKRKRSEISPALSDTQTASDRLLRRQKKQILARLTAAQKPLVAALRLGAGFERQKHSRRKKTASQKKDIKALSRLDDEYRVLKALDLEKVAEQHIRRTIGKVKSLKDHKALPENVGEIEKGNNDSARLNVLARLYKVVAVKKEVDALIEDLKGIVGAGEGIAKVQSADKTEKKRKVESKGEEEEEVEDEDMLDISDEDGVAARLLNARIAAPSSGEESDGDLSDDERPPSIGDSDSEHDPDVDLEAAGGLSNAESFDGFSNSNLDPNSDSNPDAPLNRSIAPPSDLSDFESTSDTDTSVSITTKKKPKPLQATSKSIASEFIPALSHAAYFSGDESASSLDEKPRKNRRGQRARQKIAEAKYGKAAKHIEKNERKQGWDAKRGAVNNDGARGSNRKDRRAAEKNMKARGGRGPIISGENAAPLGKKREAPKKDDLGTLHPSWAAAKAAKENKKLKIDVGGSKGVGKKVVFD